jgi:hypothetical protein
MEDFALKEGISQQTIEGYEHAYKQGLENERSKIETEVLQSATQQAADKYQRQIAELNAELKASTIGQQALEKQFASVQEQAKKDAELAASNKLKHIEQDLLQKNKQLEDFAEKEISLRNEKNALEQRAKEFELQIQRRVDEEKRQVEVQLAENFKLKEAELTKQLTDARTANDDLSRKLKQGSQQLQGEVLELEIEDVLLASFPDDSIKPVAKGARGADVLQSVMTRLGNHCGEIIWETKRAKAWNKDWVAKLKQDQQNAKASIAVIVSTVFPVETKESFIQHEGIWVVRPSAAKGLAIALRAGLISTAKQRAVTAGKDKNKEALYDYLCSPQFTQKVVAVWESQNMMKDQLLKEQTAMKRLWKVREAQLDRISTNVAEMCGELEGIAGNPLPQLDGIGQLLVE